MLELGTDQSLSPVLPPNARARTCTTESVVRPIRMMVRACGENLTVVQSVPFGLVCTSYEWMADRTPIRFTLPDNG
jgi:hypothetical protein